MYQSSLLSDRRLPGSGLQYPTTSSYSTTSWNHSTSRQVPCAAPAVSPARDHESHRPSSSASSDVSSFWNGSTGWTDSDSLQYPSGPPTPRLATASFDATPKYNEYVQRSQPSPQCNFPDRHSSSPPAIKREQLSPPRSPSSRFIVEPLSLGKRSNSQSSPTSQHSVPPSELTQAQLIERSLLSQSLAPPTEVPLRATQASKEMRKLMGVFRLNPFTLHTGSTGKDKHCVLGMGDRDSQITWCGEEAKPLEKEPRIVEWQVDDYAHELPDEPPVAESEDDSEEPPHSAVDPVNIAGLRAFSPDFDIGGAFDGGIGSPIPRKNSTTTMGQSSQGRKAVEALELREQMADANCGGRRSVPLEDGWSIRPQPSSPIFLSNLSPSFRYHTGDAKSRTPATPERTFKHKPQSRPSHPYRPPDYDAQRQSDPRAGPLSYQHPDANTSLRDSGLLKFEPAPDAPLVPDHHTNGSLFPQQHSPQPIQPPNLPSLSISSRLRTQQLLNQSEIAPIPLSHLKKRHATANRIPASAVPSSSASSEMRFPLALGNNYKLSRAPGWTPPSSRSSSSASGTLLMACQTAGGNWGVDPSASSSAYSTPRATHQVHVQLGTMGMPAVSVHTPRSTSSNYDSSSHRGLPAGAGNHCGSVHAQQSNLSSGFATESGYISNESPYTTSPNPGHYNPHIRTNDFNTTTNNGTGSQPDYNGRVTSTRHSSSIAPDMHLQSLRGVGATPQYAGDVAVGYY